MSQWSADSSTFTADSGVYTADGYAPAVGPTTQWTADSIRFTADSGVDTADGYQGPIVPPGPGFRVQAVTAGFYGNQFRTPGDVFDLFNAADFSDSTVNYEINGNTTAFGWMTKVPSGTPLYSWLASNGAPYLPPQDPARRFVL